MSSGGGPRRDQRRPQALLPVGRFFGVPLYFAPSWLLIALVITLLYSRVINDAVPGLAPGMPYLLAFAYAVLLAVSILLHELGHVAVSLALKLPVNRVVIFLLGGISEIEREPERARDEFFVAIVGPLVSIVIAGLAYVGYLVTTPNTVGWVTLGLLAFSNLLVGVFNLLPGLPLDGGRVVRAIVWGVSGRRVLATQVAAWAGRVVAVGVVVVAVYYFASSSGIESIVFAVLLAGFIWLGASQSLRVAQLQARVPALRLIDLVRPAIAVPATTPLAEALRQTWDRSARAIVIADAAGQPQAIVAEAAVAAVPVERRPWMSVADVAAPLAPGSVLPETLEGETLLQAVQSHPTGEYLVVRVDGSTVGVLAAADLAARLSKTAGTAGTSGSSGPPGTSGTPHGTSGPRGPAGPTGPAGPRR